MGQCCCVTDKSDHTPLKELKQNKDRSCTDILWLLLFGVFWIGTFVVISQAKKDGANPNRLLRGVDMNNNEICGMGVNVDRPLAAWPWPPIYNATVCVASCAETNTDKDHFALRAPSKQFLNWCIPMIINQTVALTIKFSGDFDAEVGPRSLADIETVAAIILSSAALTLVVAYLYTQFVKLCGPCLVWGCILLTIIGGFFVGYVLLQKAKEASEDSVGSNRTKALRICGWLAVVATALFLLVVFAIRDRITLAIRIVQESCNVLDDIKLLLVFPVLPVALLVSYVAFWLYIAVYLFSVAHAQQAQTSSFITHDYQPPFLANKNNPQMTVYTFNENYHNWLILHCFGLFWNTQFLVYFGYMVVAATAADWYFSITDSEGNKVRGTGPAELGHTPILEAFCRILRFHLGTLALGSLIIAIIEFARAVLTYIQKKTQGDNPNVVQKAVFVCVHAILGFLECCMDKVSKNAFIWTSIWGDGFCTAACCSFALVWRNLARVAAINLVGNSLLIVGKITIAVLTTGIYAMIFLTPSVAASISSPVLPTLMVFILSYAVSSAFMIVFETVIDTTFLCFLVDCEHNSGGNMMASKGLQDLIGEKAADSEAEAKKLYALKERGTKNGYERI